jgi:hypothetical protein
MITRHNLDKSFGPTGSSAGILLFIVGLFTIYFSFTGAVLIILGAFVGLSRTSTRIDSEKNRIMFSNDIFGFVKTGRWISVESDMKIGVKAVSKGWRARSLSNRELDTFVTDHRVFLLGHDNRVIMPILKTKSAEEAKQESEKIAGLLGIHLL